MAGYKLFLIGVFFPLIGFVVTWRIYNYFLSLSDAVHLSYFQYFVKKLIASSIVAVITMLISAGFLGEPNPTNQAQPKAEKAVSEQREQIRNTPKQEQTSYPRAEAPAPTCPPGTPTIVCKNPELIPVRNATGDALAKAYNRNPNDATWVKNELAGKINACNEDVGCIKAAYQDSISDFHAVQAESR